MKRRQRRAPRCLVRGQCRNKPFARERRAFRLRPEQTEGYGGV
jgi:hypothetical protein